ncbi:MAG: single-stranded-DNA-specific exonuclease RecJ [Brevinema sp.]
MSFFEWNLRRSDTALCREIKDSIVLPDFILNIAKNRGIAKYSEMMAFAFPQVISLPSPYLMSDMDAAVQRLVKALDGKEKILIFGDKDADGVTSTAIMHRVLSKFGANVEFRVPEGADHYGLSKEAIDDAKAAGVSIILTVDCGITAVDEAAYVKEVGLDLIITDHHEPLDVLPQAVAVVNPKLADYSFPYLSGAGVALKLAQALAEAMILPEWHDQEIVFFDIETTGLDPENDEITEIAAVITKNGVELAHFQTLVKIKGVLTAEITKITNITQKMLDETGIPRDEALQNFLDFIGDRTLAGHNIVNFDLKFLKAQLRKGLKKDINNHAVDTLSLSSASLKDIKEYNLNKVAMHLGIFSEPGALHRALVDVRLNAEVYRRIILRRCEPIMQLLHELTPLAAIGTVADIMPLQGENRIIVRMGLENIKLASTGLIALLRRLNVLENLDAKAIGWTVGPVLNSPGRLGEAGIVVDLLTCSNISKANELSELLMRKDAERKHLVSSMEEEIVSSINLKSIAENKHLCIVSDKLPRGITGLVATRLSNQFQVPVIIVALTEEGPAAGSMRATGTFDVVAMLQSLEQYFVRFGGHKSAGGFVIEQENIAKMREGITNYMMQWSSSTLRNTLDIDIELSDFSLLSTKNIHYMNNLLSPIGNKNPAPCVLVRGAVLVEAKPFGRTKEHMSFIFLKGKTEFKAIAWTFLQRWEELPPSEKYDIVGIPEINQWNGNEEVRLQLLDVNPK